MEPQNDMAKAELDKLDQVRYCRRLLYISEGIAETYLYISRYWH